MSGQDRPKNQPQRKLGLASPDLTKKLEDILKTLVADRYFALNKTGEKLDLIQKATQSITTLIETACTEARIDELEKVKLNMRDAEPPKHYSADLALNYIAHRLNKLKEKL